MIPEQKVMYLHPSRVRAVVQVLQMIFEEGKYADKAIGYVLRNNPKAGSKDRGFIAEHSYEIVRYFRFYYTWLGKVPNNENEWWQLLGIYFLHKGHELPTFSEWRFTNQTFKENANLPELYKRPVLESIPDWLDEVGEKELGAIWPDTLTALNKPAEVILRTNTLNTDRAQLAATLLSEGIETIALSSPEALQLKQRSNIFTSKAFKAGHFEVQDLSSQQVAHFVAPEPGMKVIDACAGGGGKTLHMAALMQNKGTITAMDTFDWKLQEIKQRAKRAGVFNIRTQVIEGTKSTKRLAKSAERVLLDVPCSGLGVLRRNPDAKWKLSDEFLDEVRATQQTIISNYANMTAPHGILIYATCSILPSENRKQVEKFLKSPAGEEFIFLTDKSLLPQQGFDGFYMAKMQRKS
jgi:16S rRNA (cytosine967-C5)-methyltransferase